MNPTPEAVVDQLLGSARQAESIVFLVGAGLSVDAGLPDPRRNFSKIKSARYPDRSMLQERITIARSTKVRPSRAHLALAELTPNAVITTNYDTLVEEALEATDHFAPSITGDKDWAYDPTGRQLVPVYHVHGYVGQPDTITAPELGYGDLLEDSRAAPERLQSIVAVSLVVVIGYTLADDYLADLYERFGGTSNGSSWVILSDDVDRVNQSLWESRGAAVIRTPTSLLPEVLQQLRDRRVRRQTETSRPGRVLILTDGDLGLTYEVQRFLESLDLDARVVSETPHMGMTMLEKFESLARTSAAAVVVIGEPLPERSFRRENLLFELGLLVGLLGRDRVVAVVRSGARPPADIGGIRYILFDKSRPASLDLQLVSWSRAAGLVST